MPMRPLQTLIPVEDAHRLLEQATRPVTGVETVPLVSACGRVLAEAVRAAGDVPPFSRAAMDGYAVRSGDTPGRLRCVEAVHAGEVAQARVEAGQCIEIATGAPMPAGADAVVKVEDTARDGDQIEMRVAVKAGQAVARQGSDITAGDLVLAEGTELNPSRVGALAALGRSEVKVWRRPRVSLATTGNEIVEPGKPLAPGQIYNVNAYTLAALLGQAGCETRVLRTAEDRIEAVRDVLRQALQDADLVVLTGGSSVGEKDLLQDVFGAEGEILFHGIAIKPGKPTMLAVVNGVPVVGMPGYPTSCLSNGYIFLLPLVARMAHRAAPSAPRVIVDLGEAVKSEPGKFQVLTMRVRDGQAFNAFKESGAITSMSGADGYIEIPAEVSSMEAGTPVEVTLF
ncbi:MAG: molybdopterin molybdotransferase MoeA [Candidatus Xenobia bacterium]